VAAAAAVVGGDHSSGWTRDWDVSPRYLVDADVATTKPRLTKDGADADVCAGAGERGERSDIVQQESATPAPTVPIGEAAAGVTGATAASLSDAAHLQGEVDLMNYFLTGSRSRSKSRRECDSNRSSRAEPGAGAGVGTGSHCHNSHGRALELESSDEIPAPSLRDDAGDVERGQPGPHRDSGAGGECSTTRHRDRDPTRDPTGDQDPTPEQLQPSHQPFFPGNTSLHFQAILTRAADVQWVTSLTPKARHNERWTLLYSTASDGISLKTLFRANQAAGGTGPALLLIRDDGGGVFGAYTTDRWRREKVGRCYGNGEAFVFSVYPTRARHAWTQANYLFQSGSSVSMSLGGGSHFALWIDGDLHHGTSGTCETFGSPCLSSSPEFRIRQIEVWGFTALNRAGQ